MDRINNKINKAGYEFVGLGTFLGTNIILGKCTGKINQIINGKPPSPENMQILTQTAKRIINDNFEPNTVHIINPALDSRFMKCKRHEIINYYNKIKKEKKYIPNIIIKLQKKIALNKIKKFEKLLIDGGNACIYNNEKNNNKVIVCNTQKRATSLFHEIGHAKNMKNEAIMSAMKKFGRNKKVLRNGLLLILGTALLTDKNKTENDENQTFLQKTAHFIKNNCGKLAALLYAPVTMEEGLASIHGQNFAKKYLNNELMKSVTKSHIASFASYVARMALVGFSVYLANKVRDYLVEHNKRN